MNLFQFLRILWAYRLIVVAFLRPATHPVGERLVAAEPFAGVLRHQAGIGVLGPYHRDHLARSQRHAYDIAGLELHAARHAVGIVLVERDRHQHIDDACRRGG